MGDEPKKNINPLTEKERTISDGTPLGDKRELYRLAVGKEAKLKVLKDHPELEPYFPSDHLK